MRLKKLKIHGFKSFADRTIIEFDSGITAVVGPNGCGKSNISDAIRWVMGEQSAKSMRGGSKMIDVIFAGTTSRSALNYAEVTMVLCNAKGFLPIEYKEVEITRRLHRDGESEYLINRNACRLRDIQSLFLDSGIGRHAFAIFEQGKIEQIIHNSPKDRRHIFEEAAGILRFLQRKNETLRKLGQVDQNLVRVNDIHEEVRGQLKTLGRQAEKARLYRKKQEEKDSLERSVVIQKREIFLKKEEQLAQKLESNQELKNKTKEKRDQLAIQRYELQGRLNQDLKLWEEAKEAVYKLRSEKEICDHQATSFQKSLAELLKQQKERGEERKQLLDQLDKQNQLMKEKGVLLEQVGTRAQKEEIKSKAALKELEELESSVTQTRKSRENLRMQHMQSVQKTHELSHRLQEHKVRLEGGLDQAKGVKQQLEVIQKEGDLLEKEIQSKQEVVSKQAKEIESAKQAVSAFAKQEEGLQKEHDCLKEQHGKCSQSAAEILTRRKVIQHLQEQMEGLSKDTQKLLKSPDLKNILTPLYELIQPLEGYETHVAQVLRPYMQTLVVEKKVYLEQVLHYAASQKLEDFSILCAETLDTSSTVLNNSLFERVEKNPVAASLLSSVTICDSIDEAYQCIGEGIISGKAVLDRKRILTFSSEGENNLFLREAELKELEKRYQEKKKEQDRFEENIADSACKIEEVAFQKQKQQELLRKGEMSQIESNFSLQQAKLEERKLKEKRVSLQQQLEKVEMQKKHQEVLFTESKKAFDQAQQRQKEFAEKESAAAGSLQEVDLKINELKQRQKEQTLLFRSVQEEKNNLTRLIEMTEIKREEQLKQKKKLEMQIEVLQNTLREMQLEAGKPQDGLKEVEVRLKIAGEQSLKHGEQVSKQKKQISEFNQKLQQYEKQNTVSDEKKHQFELKLAQVRSKRESIEQEIVDQLQIPIEDLEQIKIDRTLNPEEGEKALKRVRLWIQDAGAINMTSIDAFEEQKRRDDHLTSQVGDLGGSKKELLKIIQKLDTESRKIFKEVFAIVRENFQKNFRILFNGGEADLKFCGESRDPLEAGIEIVAKPPGKKMRSITLLSGGEKCLTALALLFAIFEVKTAPFCILDEVDAPLDDSNIGRFTEVLKQFIDKCQFIIITHNKRTMAIADMLFGVSMEERGVSKLLSLKFSSERTESSLVAVEA